MSVNTILHSGRWLGDVLGSKASCGCTRMSASEVETGQRWALRRSSGVCGVVEVVLSEERGGEKGLILLR
jgi:hypothetical protein